MTQEVFSKLEKEFNENVNSHVFLIETDNIEKCTKDVKKLIKNILNSDENTARQIDEETYLELIFIRPNPKDIKKDQIKDLQDRIKLQPVLSDHMIYVIENAETMNDIAANKMLKTIEEPISNTIGFFITTNCDLILPTIKSRCEILTILYGNKNEDENKEEIITLAENLIIAIEKKDHINYTKIKSNEKVLKDNYKTVENIIKNYYNTACKFKNDYKLSEKIIQMLQKGNSYHSLIAKTKYLNELQNKLSKNMNGDLLLEKIFLDMKGIG